MSQPCEQTPNSSAEAKDQLQSLASALNDTSVPVNQAASIEVTEAIEERGNSRQKWRGLKIALLQYDEQKQGQPTVMGHFLIILTLLAILVGAYFSKERVAEHRANQWLSDWQNYSNKPLKYPANSFQPSTNGASFSKAELQRIDQQLQEVHARIEIHEQIMKSFYRRYYTTTSLAAGAGIGAGICLFIITREGWKQANKGLITIFLVASTSALFFREIPRIFKYEENFMKNFQQYREYVALRNKIYSFLATETVITEVPKVTQEFERPDAEQFILSVDQRLAQLHEIHIGFNWARLDALGNSPLLDIPQESSNEE
ncbi:MAG: hypothetical protein RID09_23035 [Coleofasciculus sp. G1-WW12-02]|uniref:hypothetical protein n=1 Tax=unclassified Coleofasciculus TaxID=2692782 RepID=UPI0032F7EABF